MNTLTIWKLSTKAKSFPNSASVGGIGVKNNTQGGQERCNFYIKLRDFPVLDEAPTLPTIRVPYSRVQGTSTHINPGNPTLAGSDASSEP